MRDKRILCAVDFSAASLAALRHAEEIVRDSPSELIVAHAFHLPATWDHDGQSVPEDPTLLAKLHALEVNTPCQRVVHAGPPGEVICWLAQEHRCDLIVMGTKGHTGLSHFLFGSTAEYVLRHARCPVLTLREFHANEPELEEPIVMPIPGPGA